VPKITLVEGKTMLPFLKNKLEASVTEDPDHIKRDPDEEQEYDAIDSASEDLCKAIHSKDIKGISEALKAAFELCDSEPHIEGEHIDGD
jgi:hypothetical protein